MYWENYNDWTATTAKNWYNLGTWVPHIKTSNLLSSLNSNITVKNVAF